MCRPFELPGCLPDCLTGGPCLFCRPETADNLTSADVTFIDVDVAAGGTLTCTQTYVFSVLSSTA